MESAIQTCQADPASTVLIDLGCGDMPYRTLWMPRIAAYVGCDLPGNEFADLPIDSDGLVPLPAEHADLVLSTQVLEHVDDPQAYLAEARRLLKPSGTLILSTHGVWRFHPQPGDFWRWTSAGLRRQVEAADFRITRFRGILGPAATGLQLLQDATLPRMHRHLRRPFTRLMQSLIRLSDRWSTDEARDRDACVYFVIAVKTA
jgi:SAM-dependent methyltransferase